MTPEDRALKVCEAHTLIYTHWGDLPTLIAEAIREAVTEERRGIAAYLEMVPCSCPTEDDWDDLSLHDEGCPRVVAAWLKGEFSPFGEHSRGLTKMVWPRVSECDGE